MSDGSHLEKSTNRYPCNGLTDIEEILRGDASRPSGHGQSIKFQNLKNQIWWPCKSKKLPYLKKPLGRF